MPAHRYVALAIAALAMPALAAQQRSFVASTGSDANDCRLAAPCRSFAAAIAQTNDGGEVIVLDSAGYGPVTILKSVTIAAPPGVYAGITVFSGPGVLVGPGNITVVLRGLAINGQGGGTGIFSNVVNALHIENCVVSGMSGVGIHVVGGVPVRVRDTVVRGNAGSGMTSYGYATIERLTSEGNGGSGFSTAFGVASIVDSSFRQNGEHGLDVVGTAIIAVDRATVHGNALDGMWVINGSAQLTVARSTIEGNGLAGVTIAGEARFTDTIIARNGTLAASPGVRTMGAASRATLERTTIHRNSGYGVVIDTGAQVVTYGNNAIYQNAPGDVTGGTLTVYQFL